MIYDLPTSLNIDGVDYKIRSDWRAAIDIIVALSDADLTDRDKAEVVLEVMYEERPENVSDALNKAMWFISGGSDEKPHGKQPKLMDWEQDFPLIISAVNQVAGKELRAEPYTHWWTFLGYYSAIGDSAFTQVVSIRKKLKSGKRLEPYEKEYYKRNRGLVDFKTRYTEAEQALLNEIIGR